jgi:hypothetical protein
MQFNLTSAESKMMHLRSNPNSPSSHPYSLWKSLKLNYSQRKLKERMKIIYSRHLRRMNKNLIRARKKTGLATLSKVTVKMKMTNKNKFKKHLQLLGPIQKALLKLFRRS